MLRDKPTWENILYQNIMMKEPHLGVDSAYDLYPNGCSCGIDYKGTYKEQLLEKHTTKINI